MTRSKPPGFTYHCHIIQSFVFICVDLRLLSTIYALYLAEMPNWATKCTVRECTYADHPSAQNLPLPQYLLQVQHRHHVLAETPLC